MAVSEALRAWSERLGPQGLRNLFYLVQVGLGSLVLTVVLRKRSTQPRSGFSVREAQAQKPRARGKSDQALANARLERKVPLALEGIRAGGPPHEVLGLSPAASEEEIQEAYRARMKQYHPDKVGRPGSREWEEAQKIASAIIAARDELLRRSRRR